MPLQQIHSIKGVEEFRSIRAVPVSSDFPSDLFAEGRITLSDVSKRKGGKLGRRCETGQTRLRQPGR